MKTTQKRENVQYIVTIVKKVYFCFSGSRKTKILLIDLTGKERRNESPKLLAKARNYPNPNTDETLLFEDSNHQLGIPIAEETFDR